MLGREEVFHFLFGKVEKVMPFQGCDGTSDEIHFKGTVDIFLSYGEDQNVLGQILSEL